MQAKFEDHHAESLHASPRHGTVLIWQRQQGRKWLKVAPTDSLQRILSGQTGGTDRFISVNEFQGWRLVKLLRSLRAVFVDLDACSSIEHALQVCDDVGLPQPSYAVLSGRGVHLYWFLESAPAQTLPVWQAIQREVIKKLAVLGADPVCSDCTRVLRLVGSINTKSGTEVLGYEVTGARWSLRELANEVLGYQERKPATVTNIQRARSLTVHQRSGVFRLWHSRYQDLLAIADHWAFMRSTGVPEGKRDTLLFLQANALSWFTRSETLQQEITKNSRIYFPSLSAREVETYTRPIIQRAKAAADGKTTIHHGQVRDPRYYFQTETILDRLGGLIEPVQGLKVLLPAHVLAERERERLLKRHDQRRPEYLAQFDAQRQRIVQLRETGLTHAAIAAELGVSRVRVTQLLRGM
jgi:hypothetical protein